MYPLTPIPHICYFVSSDFPLTYMLLCIFWPPAHIYITLYPLTPHLTYLLLYILWYPSHIYATFHSLFPISHICYFLSSVPQLTYMLLCTLSYSSISYFPQKDRKAKIQRQAPFLEEYLIDIPTKNLLFPPPVKHEISLRGFFTPEAVSAEGESKSRNVKAKKNRIWALHFHTVALGNVWNSAWSSLKHLWKADIRLGNGPVGEVLAGREEDLSSDLQHSLKKPGSMTLCNAILGDQRQESCWDSLGGSRFRERPWHEYNGGEWQRKTPGTSLWPLYTPACAPAHKWAHTPQTYAHMHTYGTPTNAADNEWNGI